MNTAEITIQGKTFSAPMPFAAGHVLTDVEAAVLNQTFHENLRNNFAGKMKKAQEDKQAELTQADFDAYAAQYKFGVRPTGVARETDPVRSEAKKLARDQITIALKARGFKIKELPEGKMDELIEEALVKHPKFLEQAKQIVDARKSAVAGLADLNLGV